MDNFAIDLTDTATVSAPLLALPTQLNIDINPEKLLSYIYTCLLIICALVVIITRIASWHKEAKKDKEISKAEVKELVDILKDGAEEIGTILVKEDDTITLLKPTEEAKKQSKYRITQKEGK